MRSDQRFGVIIGHRPGNDLELKRRSAEKRAVFLGGHQGRIDRQGEGDGHDSQR